MWKYDSEEEKREIGKTRVIKAKTWINSKIGRRVFVIAGNVEEEIGWKVEIGWQEDQGG